MAKNMFSAAKQADKSCEHGSIYGKIICYEDTNFYSDKDRRLDI